MVDAAKAALGGETAKWLKDEKFTYVCTERVYLPPPNPHLTWWGWASPESPTEVFGKLKRAFPGGSSDGKSFTLFFTPRGATRPEVVVAVAEIAHVGGVDVASEGVPICKDPLPTGTRSFVNVSELPP